MLEIELVTAKEQVESAHNNVLVALAARSSAEGLVDELTMKVAALEELLGQLQGRMPT